MFDKVMKMLSDSFTACVDWLQDIYTAVGEEFTMFLLAAFIVFTVYRFLLAPIVGGRSISLFSGVSDSYKKSSKKQSKQDGKTKQGESETAKKNDTAKKKG